MWDFGHRPPPDAKDCKENNQRRAAFVSKGRFQLDEVANEIYIINQKRVLVYDMNTGAFKRGWGGHGMPLSEITNDPLPSYKWTGGPPPEEKNFVPDLHFVEISKDRQGLHRRARTEPHRGVHHRRQVAAGLLRVAELTRAARRMRRPGRVDQRPTVPIAVTFYQSICGTTYKMVISKDPQQKYLFVADAHNDVIWTVERQSGKTLGYFGGSGRLAGQMTFPNAIGIDTLGNVYVGEVDYRQADPKVRPGPHGRAVDGCNCCECKLASQ